MITGVPGRSSDMTWSTWKPSAPGIATSSRARSKLRSRTALMAASPSSAASTS